MRSSPLSHAAESVFKYDLQRELEDDLDRLRKKACVDGDVVFILPNQTFVWVHSPLFYVAANKLPVEFGVEAGTSMNDRGIQVKMVFVQEEKRSELEDALAACYTQDNLALLWKATSRQDLRFESKYEHTDIDTGQMNLALPLPTSMLPDFEIHLREVDREQIDESPSFSLKVHRFLLDARIDYYRTKTHFGSNLRDATPMASNLSKTTFTEFSLWAIATYVYCGMPSAIFSLDPNLKEYIAELGDNSNLKQKVHCTALRTEGRLPAEGIEQGLLDIARAANFLLVPELEAWAHFQLYRVAHRFQCTGTGCAEILPYIIDAVYQNEITDEWMFHTGITWLARYENIPTLWKWSLLCVPKVVNLLIGKIIEDSIEQRMGENEETSYKRGEDTIELFVRLWKLKQYTSMTKDSEKWESQLIEPLMGHAIEVVVEDLNNSVASTIVNRLGSLVHDMSFSKLAGEELLMRIIAKMEANGITKDLDKLVELYEKKGSINPLETSHGKHGSVIKPSATTKKTKESFVDHLAASSPHRGSSSAEKKVEVKKPLKSRLKGSAAPFIPRGLSMPLGALGNLDNIVKEIDNTSPIFSGQENQPLGVQNTQEICMIPDSKRSLSQSGSEKSFRASKRPGFKLRRILSTPVSRTDESHEMRMDNVNRRFTSPTIGGAIPFRQQMQMSSFYDTSR